MFVRSASALEGAIFVFFLPISLQTRLQAQGASDELVNNPAAPYRFDSDKPSDKPWVLEVLREFPVVDTTAELALKGRKQDASFQLQGPRTFVLSMGLTGATIRKSEAQVLKHSGGHRADFIIVDHDAIWMQSPAWQAILRRARRYDKFLPWSMATDDNITWRLPSGEQLKKGTYNWLGVAQHYVASRLSRRMFDPTGRSSVLYQHACVMESGCLRLLQRARKEGRYDQVVVVSTVDHLACEEHRANMEQPQLGGQRTPEGFIRWSERLLRRAVPKVMEQAKELFPDSWIVVSASPDPGAGVDEHGCSTSRVYRREMANLPKGPGGGGDGKKKPDEPQKENEKDKDKEEPRDGAANPALSGALALGVLAAYVAQVV